MLELGKNALMITGFVGVMMLAIEYLNVLSRGAWQKHLAAADQNRVIRIPGKWEYDRIAARRPDLYGPITEPKRA